MQRLLLILAVFLASLAPTLTAQGVHGRVLVG